jgi:hypothetical protein
MRKFLPLGGSLDINTIYASNGVDSGISYNIPESQRVVATINSNGVVTPISVGTVSVEIKSSSGSPIAYYTVAVVTQEQYAKLSPLENSDNLKLDN